MRPATEEEMVDAIRGAQQSLRILGGGTRTISMADAGPVLATTGVTGVVLYEPAALTLVARAGTPIAEIDRVLAAEQQRLAFEVPNLCPLLAREGQSTIGGVVAANASGPRRVQAGACRDALIGVRFVDGSGNLIRNGGRVMKNVTGLDLVKLMAGSWGRLGVLTEVSFKVQAMPEAEATIWAEGLDNEAAVGAMTQALGSPYDLTGAAVVGRQTLLRIEGLEGSVAYRAQALTRRLGAGWQILNGPQSADLWRAVRDVSPFVGRPGAVWKISLRPGDAPRLLRELAGLGAERMLDWGGGLVWLRVEAAPDAGAAHIRAAVASLGGHATLMRGAMPGVSVFPPEPPAIAALTAGLRAKFDPRGIFTAGGMA